MKVRLDHHPSYCQWPFQDPKLEVPTIYKAYFSGLNFREYPTKYGPKYGTNVQNFRIMTFPLILGKIKFMFSVIRCAPHRQRGRLHLLRDVTRLKDLLTFFCDSSGDLITINGDLMVSNGE